MGPSRRKWSLLPCGGDQTHFRAMARSSFICHNDDLVRLTLSRFSLILNHQHRFSLNCVLWLDYAQFALGLALKKKKKNWSHGWQHKLTPLPVKFTQEIYTDCLQQISNCPKSLWPVYRLLCCDIDQLRLCTKLQNLSISLFKGEGCNFFDVKILVYLYICQLLL